MRYLSARRVFNPSGHVATAFVAAVRGWRVQGRERPALCVEWGYLEIGELRNAAALFWCWYDKIRLSGGVESASSSDALTMPIGDA